MGILEGGAKAALRNEGLFGVITTGAGWVQPLTAANLEAVRPEERDRLAGVRATGLGVLDFHGEDDGSASNPTRVHDRIAGTAKAFTEETAVRTIVMGCAGMEGMEEAIEAGTKGRQKKVVVIDSVAATTALLCEELSGH